MAAGPSNAKVTADIRKNRLIFRCTGAILKKDLDRLYTDVRFCVADLKPGFHVITDLSECRFANLNCITTFRKIMNYLLEKQAGQVIRIINSTSLIHKQIRNLSARFQGYKPVYVESLDEAERLLENCDSRQDLCFRLHRPPVHFETDTIKHTGYIREISTASCGIECITTDLHSDEEIVLQLEFARQDEAPETFEIRARVTDIEPDHFTAQFLDFDDERRQLLRNCIVREVQKEG